MEDKHIPESALTSLSRRDVIKGVIAAGVNVSRYGSVQAAESGFTLSERAEGIGVAAGSPNVGAGEESILVTKQTVNSRGEAEYSAVGIVRVRNVTSYFSIGGDEEADFEHALMLLQQVAAEL